MTEQRLREIASESDLPFVVFLVKARRAFGLAIQPSHKLTAELIVRCNEIGDEEAENAIAAVL